MSKSRNKIINSLDQIDQNYEEHSNSIKSLLHNLAKEPISETQANLLNQIVIELEEYRGETSDHLSYIRDFTKNLHEEFFDSLIIEFFDICQLITCPFSTCLEADDCY